MKKFLSFRKLQQKWLTGMVAIFVIIILPFGNKRKDVISQFFLIVKV